LYAGSTYNIPICIYLRKDHPYNPPHCVVVPTAGMALTGAPWMDARGFVYLPYLSEWKMVSLIHNCKQQTFAVQNLCSFHGLSINCKNLQ